MLVDAQLHFEVLTGDEAACFNLMPKMVLCKSTWKQDFRQFYGALSTVLLHGKTGAEWHSALSFNANLL